MPPGPLISICIPAYKRADSLKKLLDSIAIQSWKDFEVIVTDDSPDESVWDVCREYQMVFPLFYHHNQASLGTPGNWNEAMRRAKGKWIKLMHDDDWFVHADSLASFAAAIDDHPGTLFIFSAYNNVYPDGHKKAIRTNFFRLNAFMKRPATLFSLNCIGPPSCVLFEKKDAFFFDKQFKWLVDIEFYIRYTRPGSTVYIKDVLVDIGIGDTQVTKVSLGNPLVEIPENFLLLEKVGQSNLMNLLIFDAFWRLIRNFHIREVKAIREYGFPGKIPAGIAALIRFQNKIPSGLLAIGPVSKILMSACFIFTYLDRRHN